MRLPHIIRPLAGAIALAAMIPVGTSADDPNGTWVQITPSGSTPPYRRYFAATHDPVGQRLIVDGRWPDCYNDTWSLSLSGTPAWTQLVIGSAFERSHHGAIYDAPRNRVLIFGWWDCYLFGNSNGVKTLDLSSPTAWSWLIPEGVPPSGRVRHSMIYDPERDRMIVFGGQPWSSSSVNEVWELALSGTPTWTQIVPAGTPPAARQRHTAIYDPVRDVMLVFGGSTAAGRVNDLWQLTLDATPTWSQVTPAGTPPAGRSMHSAVYDPVRDRMVVFGGWSLTGDQMNDVWALSLGGAPTWSQLNPAGMLPLVREGHEAIYDPPRDRMVVYGGHNPPEDLWALDWTGTVGVEPTPVGSRPMTLRLRPNPVSSDVAVEFALPRPGPATLHVYDVSGRLVRVLLDGEAPAGDQCLIWDGRAHGGERVEPGVYMLRLRAGGELRTSRIVLVD